MRFLFSNITKIIIPHI